MHSGEDIFRSSRSAWGGKSLIHSVENVRYSFLKRFPPVLVISADGWVSTAGRSEPELRALPAHVRARAGLLELAFVSRLARHADDLHPIHAELEWRDSPETIHEITVHANTNQITTTVGRA